jgi:glycosyltransferase involved in cell wall biosynthesis
VYITLINQAFYPDVVATGQYLADLASGLARMGHEVRVVTSRRGYDDPRKLFPKEETWRGVHIYRVSHTGFGKGSRWRRAADFASFTVACFWKLLWLPEEDVILALTSPPLVSFGAALFAHLRLSRFCYWVMDLNPDEALAAGWLAPGSLAARWLERLSRFSLEEASAIIALDRFMKQRILDKGIDPEKIVVIPPWSQDEQVRFDAEGRAQFRQKHGLEGKFVVMYSGNHSPVHPLATLLEAAKRLAGNPELVFCFVGGGSEFGRVRHFAAEHGLRNVLCLPYQPIAELSGVLSAADLHLIVMGEPFVGIVHPCKVYNILRVGAPVVYIGPAMSHITEVLEGLRDRMLAGCAAHGDADELVRQILRIRDAVRSPGWQRPVSLSERFSRETLLRLLTQVLVEPAGSRQQPARAKRRVATFQALVPPVWDMLCLAGALAVSMRFFEVPRAYGWRDWFFDLPVWATPTLCLLAMSRVYATGSPRAGPPPLRSLWAKLVAGLLLSLTLASLIDPANAARWLGRAWIVGMLACPAIFGTRLVFRLTKEFVVYLMHNSRLNFISGWLRK